MDDTKRIDSIEQLKEISLLNSSPCVNCETDDGCPSMAMCKVYQEYKQRCKNLLITFTDELLGKKSETQQ